MLEIECRTNIEKSLVRGRCSVRSFPIEDKTDVVKDSVYKELDDVLNDSSK